VALHRVQLKDEELQSKKREQHLDFLVGQTEKFSKMIAADMQGVTPTLTNAVANAASSAASAEAADDRCVGCLALLLQLGVDFVVQRE
jgi:hypothetical protein